ncbi:Rid family detoxifying hydrolase [Pseudalkalibacillus sp. A8]|uniref:Rid family detoxifying hydrolase n=1 Tax=Pseudalkalibacillus sp. A8 TaxID=3382641 RepID=UPI0038B49FAC
MLSNKIPAAIGPYSHKIRSKNDLLFISGQIPIDPETNELVEGGVVEQTQQCLENLKAILNSEGMDYSNLLKVTIYCTDMANFQAINEVYAGVLDGPPPARAVVGINALPKGALVEIEGIAN